ncbi:MAG: hypothetical protein JWN43_4294 [Gammaproteobacteria bacterium]|nr:hypothetical protein [Gammaproteobacteria bacterium]
MKRTQSVTNVAAVVICAANWSQAVAGDLVTTLQSCTAERDDLRRLACYDKALSRPPARSGDTFGLSKPEKRPVQEPAKLTGKVVAVTQRPQGGVVLTLDNDQVWAEQDPGGYFAINVGDSVTVKPGLLGGFLLTGSATGNRSIRVKREK